ncbi:putative maltose permease [Talaromyces proteolyticus]|uniref:Maltose permease n=1 Tax=Talaromyces proteolyticus TaxID=1131652 RepID=A0AAD4Q573_9EURO|nr:putative maltose permease [Talaromyces proteolyticus]KAH8703986.1 putative maltose permease [Talaromyces proteolyticus]
MTSEINVEKSAATHLEDTLGSGAIIEAKRASDEEHSQTLWQAINANRKAVAWSMLISLSIVMEGYDVVLIGNFFAYPQFTHMYGQDYGGKTGWQISTPWQSGLNMSSTIGTIFGGLLNGYMTSRVGYRWVMITSLAALNALLFIVFFAPSLGVLVAGEMLCGFTWGVFAIVGPSYASEVCPTNLRGYLTIYVNLCWAIGQFIAAGVLEGLIHRNDEWAYRIPFALQWIWPLPLMVVCFFAPESPWYLVRKDRLEAAKHSLRRLGGNKTEDQINGQLAMLVHTIKIESELEKGSSYLDCFRGTDLRRTEICCLAFVGQILSGSTFAYSPSYFFTTAGMSTDHAYQLSLGDTAIAFVGTICSWWLITHFGRRIIYLTGQGVLFVVLFLIGIINSSTSANSAVWAQAGLCIFWLLVYSLTVGPIAYAIVSETSSIRLRSMTVSLARVSYQVINVVSQVLEPYFMNPTAWNASGKTGFFWGCTALFTFIWAYFRLPEAKGRTYEELDILFARKVSARKFASEHVDAYGAQGIELEKEEK